MACLIIISIIILLSPRKYYVGRWQMIGPYIMIKSLSDMFSVIIVAANCLFLYYNANIIPNTNNDNTVGRLTVVVVRYRIHQPYCRVFAYMQGFFVVIFFWLTFCFIEHTLNFSFKYCTKRDLSLHHYIILRSHYTAVLRLQSIT